ncbi:MAG TPA: D-alanyl-D-alanine carboxypeptidase family protein [Verrucomicrobiae bacterium]|nr:D-alanyl-D-alanine carboxypeptidase family protein [Verrucomicrobiae bacterium]
MGAVYDDQDKPTPYINSTGSPEAEEANRLIAQGAHKARHIDSTGSPEAEENNRRVAKLNELRTGTGAGAESSPATEGKGSKNDKLADSKGNALHRATPEPLGASRGNSKGKGGGSRKKLMLFGGGSAMSIAALFIGFTFTSGFVEFIHFGKVLQRHFAGIDDVMDDQQMSRIRYRRRLGLSGNKAADIIERQLNKAGFTSLHDAAGYFQGFEIDPKKVSAAQLERLGGHLDTSPNGGRMLVLEPGSNFRRRKLMNNVLKAAKIRFIPSKVSSRIMRTRGGISFHILGNVDRKAHTTLSSYTDEVLKKFTDFFREGSDLSVRASGETQNDDGTDLSDEERAASQSGADDFNETIDGVKTDPSDAKISQTAADVKTSIDADKAADFLGFICAARGIGDQWQKLMYARIALPLARLGVAFISISSQIMSGDKVSMHEVSAMAIMLHDKNLPWNSARSIQYELGRTPTGPDMPKSSRLSRIGNKPAFFDIVDRLPVGTACKINNNVVGGLVISFATGGIVLDSIMTGLGAIGIDPVGDGISSIISWAVGQPLKAIPTGALLGNYANYGSLLGSFNQFLGIGARVLTSEEGMQLREERLAAEKIDFETKPIATRIFDPTEPRSVAGQAFIGAPKTGSEAFASLSNALWKFPSTVATMFTKLTFKHAGAAGTYDYGVDYVGFTSAEMNDARFIDPYANDNTVEPQLAELNEKYGKCFGTTIDPTSKQIITDKVPNYFEDDFSPCRITPENSEYTTFTQYRFYLLGKAVERSMECWGGIEDSCKQAQGKVTAAAATSAAVGAAGPGLIVGNPTDDSTSVPCAQGTRDIGIQDGYNDGNRVPVRLCSIPNIPSNGRGDSPGAQFTTPGADGHVIVNSRVSGAWFKLASDAAAAGIQLSASTSFRSMAYQEELWRTGGGDTRYVARPGHSNHQNGTAIDFTGMSDKGGTSCTTQATFPSSPAWVWLTANAPRYGFRQLNTEAWHWSPGVPCNPELIGPGPQ